MEYVRGPVVGRGSFASVNLVIPVNSSSRLLPTMVVKSSPISQSESLRREKQAILDVGDCPEIVRFYGDGMSYENGNKVCNLFFEYAEKGSLEDCLRNSGGKFKDCDVKRYTKAILKGLCQIHDKGYAHCDIKLSNVLLFDNGAVKVADFGLATKIGAEESRCQLKGTPLYMSPELINGGETRSPVDIWALGCAVVQMFTGKSVWEMSPKCDVNSLICRIGMGKECPQVPNVICLEGKDFISKCFIKDPNIRWTARMLLDHPFVNGFDDDDQEPSVSPRDPFEFSGLEFTEPSSLESMGVSCLDPFHDNSGFDSSENCRKPACGRLGDMTNNFIPDWSNSYGWVNVR